jgi:hypothetical protein
MDVSLDPGTADTSDIHPDIEALRMERIGKGFQTPLRALHDPGRFFLGQPRELTCMCMGDDHQMSTVVRIQVHHDKTGRPTIHDEVFLIAIRTRKNPAKETLSRLFRILRFMGKRFNIFRSPG